MSLTIKAETKGALLAFIGAMFIVPDSLYVRLIDGDGLVTAFWRNVIAGLVIALLLVLTSKGSVRQTFFPLSKIGIWYAIFVSVSSISFVVAITNTSVASVLYILAAMPVFTAILGRLFLNDAVDKAFGLVMVFVLVGLGLIAFHSDSSGINSGFGNLMAIITMMGFSVSVTLARKEKSKSMLPALSIGLLISGVFIALIVDPIEAFNLKPELYLLHGVTLAIAVSALAQAARYTKGSIVTLFMLLEAALAPIVAWYIFSEYPGALVIGGGLLVMMTVALYGVWSVAKPHA